MSVSMGPGESTPMIAAREGVSVSVSVEEEEIPEVIYQRASFAELDFSPKTVRKGVRKFIGLFTGPVGSALDAAAEVYESRKESTGEGYPSGGIPRDHRIPATDVDFDGAIKKKIDLQNDIEDHIRSQY